MRDIGDLLRETLVEEGLGRVEDLLKVKRAWGEMEGVPEGVPCGFRGGKLVIRVSSHAWAQELSMRREELLGRLEDMTGLRIEGIVIKVKPKV